MDFFIIVFFVSIAVAISGYFANLIVDGTFYSSGVVVSEPSLLIALIFFGIFLILNSSYFIILYILYFIIGYFFCLNHFPSLNENDYTIEFDSLNGIALVFDIVVFWPFYILSKFIRKINFSKFLKTPISEWKKKNNL